MTRATVWLTPGHRDQALDSNLKRGQGVAQPRLQLAYRGLQRIDLREVQLQHEPAVVGNRPVQRVDEGGPRSLEPPLRQGGQPLGILFARDQGLQNRPATDAQYVADHRRELQVGVLQDLLQAQRVLGDLAHELFAGAR
jgi:hypothetical protein